jgi:hypothetical protein
MSLYIKHENQTLLWNTIHSHPKFLPHLKQYPTDKISGWFRSTIEGFYRKWGENRPISPEELKQLNQNTITYLYQSITSLGQTPPVQYHPSVQQQPQQQQHQQQHPSLPKPLPDFHGQYEFEQRAQEYQSMNAKPMAEPLQGKTDADQRESQETMERKWMEQQRLREKDVEHFSPPSQINSNQPAINLNLLKSTAPSGGRGGETENIQLKIREITEMKIISPPDTVPAKEIPEKEPEWLQRLKHLEDTQEKMSKQLEQIYQQMISTTPFSATTKNDKFREIDE